MGSFIELNDTLQITTEQGFPADILDWQKHQQEPIPFSEVEGKTFSFAGKLKARIYHTPPCRCFLVHNIDEKWLYWGHILMIEQTIYMDELGDHFTRGKFQIIKIYDPEYMRVMTTNETRPGENYFE